MIHIVQIGIGALGKQVLQYAIERKGLHLAGVVDINPELTGKDAGSILGGETFGIKVSGSIAEALKTAPSTPRVAMISTVSSVEKLIPQIEEAAKAGLHIVTTCEEMIYPWRQHTEAAEQIDDICKKNKVVCLGTGVNPGFIMDFLPAVFSSVSQQVDHILVERVQDASKRRVPFQKKIGAGLSHKEFDDQKLDGKLGHTGLPESIDLIAAAIGWELDKEHSESLKPVLSDRDTEEGYKNIKIGLPAGAEQIGRGFSNGSEVIKLVFKASVGEKKSCDRISIKGLPNINMEIAGGVNGDVATSAITVNVIRSVFHCSPGLKTMLDVPVPAHYWNIK